jgi:hypothetical protein
MLPNPRILPLRVSELLHITNSLVNQPIGLEDLMTAYDRSTSTRD